MRAMSVWVGASGARKQQGQCEICHSPKSPVHLGHLKPLVSIAAQSASRVPTKPTPQLGVRGRKRSFCAPNCVCMHTRIVCRREIVWRAGAGTQVHVQSRRALCVRYRCSAACICSHYVSQALPAFDRKCTICCTGRHTHTSSRSLTQFNVSSATSSCVPSFASVCGLCCNLWASGQRHTCFSSRVLGSDPRPFFFSAAHAHLILLFSQTHGRWRSIPRPFLVQIQYASLV